MIKIIAKEISATSNTNQEVFFMKNYCINNFIDLDIKDFKKNFELIYTNIIILLFI
jgi:hypothetical protein